MKVREGDMVHFVAAEEVFLPAVVAKVLDREQGIVNLTVFADTGERARTFGGPVALMKGVREENDGHDPGTWHEMAQP